MPADNTDLKNRGAFKIPAAARKGPWNGKLAPYVRSAKGVAVRDERVMRLAKRIVDAFPWLTSADRDLVRVFAQVQILTDECYRKLDDEGVMLQTFDKKRGRVSERHAHPLLSEYRCLVRVLADVAGRLGLTPRDRAIMTSATTGAALDLNELRKVADEQTRNSTRDPARRPRPVLRRPLRGDDVGDAAEAPSGD